MVAVRHFVVMGDDREVKKSGVSFARSGTMYVRYSKSSVSLSVYVCIKDHQHAYRPHLSYTVSGIIHYLFFLTAIALQSRRVATKVHPYKK